MRIETDLSLGPDFTFEPSKNIPVYNWLYYKEAFSPGLVSRFLDGNEKLAYDPFCGVGTALLKAKESGISSIGTDTSSIAVFASMAKTRDYSAEDAKGLEDWLGRLNPDGYAGIAWKSEIISPEKAFPRRNLGDIARIREAIERLDGKPRDLALLALISILPMASLIIKDGGVLKIDNSKKAGDALALFKRKARHFIDDIRNSPVKGPVPEVKAGSALNIEASPDKIITSPPYLNSIDYTKVYNLEISLLNLDFRAPSRDRGRSMPSFVTKNAEAVLTGREYIDRYAFIPIVGSYFDFTIKAIKEFHRALRPGGKAIYVVADAVVGTTYIPVDEICATIAEEEGFEAKVIIGLRRKTRINGRMFDTRESAVAMEK
jgi:DNA modification methylase